jgi:hypothetical protein
MFECLIQMYDLSMKANKGDVVLNFEDCVEMFSKGGPCTEKFISDSSIQNLMTLSVTNGEWIGNYKQFAFSHNTALLGPK